MRYVTSACGVVPAHHLRCCLRRLLLLNVDDSCVGLNSWLSHFVCCKGYWSTTSRTQTPCKLAMESCRNGIRYSYVISDGLLGWSWLYVCLLLPSSVDYSSSHWVNLAKTKQNLDIQKPCCLLRVWQLCAHYVMSCRVNMSADLIGFTLICRCQRLPKLVQGQITPNSWPTYIFFWTGQVTWNCVLSGWQSTPVERCALDLAKRRGEPGQSGTCSMTKG